MLREEATHTNLVAFWIAPNAAWIHYRLYLRGARYPLHMDAGRVVVEEDIIVKQKFRVVKSARPCNKVGHLFWFTILAQHETDDVILFIHSVYKNRGNSLKLQNYKMRLKQIRLDLINSMQEKKILFTNVFFSWSLCLLNMF